MRSAITMNFDDTVETSNYLEMVKAIVEPEDRIEIYKGNFYIVMMCEDEGKLNELRSKLP